MDKMAQVCMPFSETWIQPFIWDYFYLRTVIICHDFIDDTLASLSSSSVEVPLSQLLIKVCIPAVE